MASTSPPGKAADPRGRQSDEVNVFTEPKNADTWLELIRESEKVFEEWNDACDNIDKLYANLERLRVTGRDRQFQMFWSNIQVLAPIIYARPPIPVVVPKFKDRRPIPQAASEMAERCATVSFDLAYVHPALKQARDSLTLHGRGVLWCRHEKGKNGRPEKVCIEHKDRRDFLHSIVRNWYEVEWVAAASYLTRAEAKKRFRKYSKDAYDKLDYKVDRDSKSVGGTDDRERAKIWEVWHRTLGLVVWVSEGSEVLLDYSEPHLDLQGYFPCPQPAYSTVQPGTLMPIPDVEYYRDQLEELNALTGRIHALADAIEVKGFYPSGGNEIADAVEKAIKMKSSSRILVPISNWAAFGGSKEVIVWLPIDVIAATVNELVTLRKQIIDDIYQIVGLSDIMRGSTDPQETLGAQKMKMQSGAVRIRDKQGEMARIAKDCVHISIEIITEKFEDETITDMAQMQLPRRADIKRQIQAITQQVQQQTQQLSSNPQAMQQLQQNPQAMQQAQQLMQQAQQQVQKLSEKATIEDVLAFLRNYRTRAFVLDIETDSTIMIDEQQEKEQRGEFVTVLSGLIQQLGVMITTMPQTAKFGGEVLKFAVAPYRAGRQLDGAIDEMVEQLGQMAASGQLPQGGQQQKGGEDPQAKLQLEQMKMQHAAQENDKDRNLQMTEIMSRMRVEQIKVQNEKEVAMLEFQGAERERQAKMAQIAQQMQRDREKAAQDAQKSQRDFVLGTQKAQIQQRGMQDKNVMARQGMAMKAQDAALGRQQKQAQFNQASRQKDQQFAQSSQLKEKQMMMPKGAPQ